MRTRGPVLLALAFAAGLSAGLASRQPDQRRPAEILTQIMDLRQRSLDHVLALQDAGLAAPESYVAAYANWADARVRLARAQGDAGAERVALNDLLAVLRRRAEEVSSGLDRFGQDAHIEAQIAVLECELRIQRLGARRGGGGGGGGDDAQP